jgi:hypothetical protein
MLSSNMVVIMLIVQATGHSAMVITYGARGVIYNCYMFIVQAISESPNTAG